MTIIAIIFNVIVCIPILLCHCLRQLSKIKIICWSCLGFHFQLTKLVRPIVWNEGFQSKLTKSKFTSLPDPGHPSKLRLPGNTGFKGWVKLGKLALIFNSKSEHDNHSCGTHFIFYVSSQEPKVFDAFCHPGKPLKNWWREEEWNRSGCRGRVWSPPEYIEWKRTVVSETLFCIFVGNWWNRHDFHLYLGITMIFIKI